MKSINTFGCLIVLVLAGFFAAKAEAQTSFEAAYGNGVHHYFNHEYQKAYDSLSLALAEDGQDARAYYYRGLASQRLGLGGMNDFEMGARVEAAQGGRLSLVNDSLERIQGSTRIQIEDLRRSAVMTAKLPSQNPPGIGRTFPVRNTGGVVEVPAVADKTPAPATEVISGQEIEPANKSAPAPDVVEIEPESFGGGAPTTDTPPAEVDASPFGGQPKVEEVSPFGDAKEMTGTEEAGSTPFGETAPDDSSPFGAEPAEESPSPFGSEPASEDNEPASDVSPFGAEPATEDPVETNEASPFGDAPATESTEPASETSPFGDAPTVEPETPAEQSGGAPDDPFGT